MKKFLVILMTLAMVISCISAMAVTSSAHNYEYVEETYKYKDAADADFGSHTPGEDGGLAEAPLLGNGLWTYEWFDVSTKTFAPMSAWFSETLTGWSHGGWANFYTATVDSVWSKVGNTYCTVGVNGTRMHPGDTAGAVITFIVPVSGNISFEGSVYPYGTHTSDQENGGDALYLYVNDTLVYPANPDDAVFYSDTASQDNPAKVELNAFDVKEGDKVRFVLTTKPGTTNGSKGCNIVTFPTVTYHSTTDGTPVGNPKGYPPENVLTSDTTSDGCTATWDAAKNAVGYNIYVDGQKVNSTPVTETQYVITGLQPKTVYSLTITTVNAKGDESDPSGEASFRTKKGEGVVSSSDVDTGSDKVSDNSTTGTITDNVDDATTTAGNVTTTTAPAESGSSILWIIIAAAVAAVVAIVVVVIVLSKKKKAE